jgi:hypothetical protein
MEIIERNSTMGENDLKEVFRRLNAIEIDLMWVRAKR